MKEVLHATVVHAAAIGLISITIYLFHGPLLAILASAIANRGLVRSVAGRWEAIIHGGDLTYRQQIELRQLGTRVWGTIECEKNNRRFRVAGRVNHHTFIAQYELLQGADVMIDNGTFSLTLNDDGDEMSGQLACRDGSGCYVWHRVKAGEETQRIS